MRFSERPILAGLTALAAVSLGFGLLLGLGAVVASWGLGLGDSGSTTTATTNTGDKMRLPKPKPTEDAVGPLISAQPEPSETESTGAPASPIVLAAAQTSVAPMQQIDLTGTYPGKDGAILQVQRFQSGAWQDFPATPMTVNAGTFSTYIQTGQPGENRFRVVDTDDQTPSNEIIVTING